MRKKGSSIWLVLCLLILPFENNAQDLNALLKDAQQLEASFKEAEALQKYLDVLRFQPTNLTALTKASELYSILGKHQPSKERKNLCAKSVAGKRQQLRSQCGDVAGHGAYGHDLIG